MRILIVTMQDRFFLSHVKERALYFQQKGCIVGVAAQKTSQEAENQIRALGFNFFDTKIQRKSLNVFTQLSALFRLFLIHTKFKPDVSYHLGAKPIIYSTFISRIYNSKVAVLNAPTGLGYIFTSNDLRAQLLRPIVLRLYRLFLNPENSKVIIENNDDIRFFIENKCLRPQDAYCILGAGVNTSQFTPLPLSERNDVCTVIMAARLVKEKGVWDFVNAAKLLHENNIPVKMQLIGAPDFGNPSSLTDLDIKKIKESSFVEYLGFQSDMVNILQKAHICCLPSYREGLPRVLIEAASSGLAILTTDAVGCKETVRDNNGFLFQPRHPKQIAQLITYLIKHPDELVSMMKKSRKVALAYFDSNIICQRTFEIIRTLKTL